MFRGSRVISLFRKSIFCQSVAGHQSKVMPFVLNSKFTRGSASHEGPSGRKSSYESMVERGLYLETPFLRSAKSKITDVNVVDEGKNVAVTWDDGITSRYHSLWLKHACHCPACRRLSNQTQVTFQDIDTDVTVTKAEIEGDKLLTVEWSDDSHIGLFPLPYLKHKDYGAAATKERENQKKITFCHKESLPEISYEEVMTTETGLYRWIEALSGYGICLIKDVPTRDREVKTVAERISIIQATEAYGDVFNVTDVPKSSTFAYTTGDVPLHQDMQWLESPPGIQLLHCVRFDKEVTGGINEFVDMFYVVEELRCKHPREFDDLVRIPASFEVIYYHGNSPEHMMFKQPHISLNQNHEIIAVRWHPASTGALQTKEEDVESYYKAYAVLQRMVANFPFKYSLRFQEGDLITMNNRRWAHGRSPYNENGGVRHLQGCYVQMDEFQNQAQLYSNKLGDGKLTPRLGNNSWE